MASLSYSSLQSRRREWLGQSQDAPRGSNHTQQSGSTSKAGLTRTNAKLAIASLRDSSDEESDLARAEAMLEHSRRKIRSEQACLLPTRMAVEDKRPSHAPTYPDSLSYSPHTAASGVSEASPGASRWLMGGSGGVSNSLHSSSGVSHGQRDRNRGGGRGDDEHSDDQESLYARHGDSSHSLDARTRVSELKDAELQSPASSQSLLGGLDLSRSEVNLSTIIGASATMLNHRGRFNVLLRRAVAKERQRTMAHAVRVWVHTCWSALRTTTRALATMSALGQWVQPAMARGREGNLWAVASRRPSLTLAQLIRVRKLSMEKLAWLVLVQRRASLVSFFGAWRHKLSSWRILRSYLPKALRLLTASKESKSEDRIRPMWRVWETAGSVLLQRVWRQRSAARCVTLLHAHAARTRHLRRFFRSVRLRRMMRLVKVVLLCWRECRVSIAHRQARDQRALRRTISGARRVATSALRMWEEAMMTLRRRRRVTCLVMAGKCRRELVACVRGWSQLAQMSQEHEGRVVAGRRKCVRKMLAEALGLLATHVASERHLKRAARRILGTLITELRRKVRMMLQAWGHECTSRKWHNRRISALALSLSNRRLLQALEKWQERRRRVSSRVVIRSRVQGRVVRGSRALSYAVVLEWRRIAVARHAGAVQDLFITRARTQKTAKTALIKWHELAACKHGLVMVSARLAKTCSGRTLSRTFACYLHAVKRRALLKRLRVRLGTTSVQISLKALLSAWGCETCAGNNLFPYT
jgi:hypothetical protein